MNLIQSITISLRIVVSVALTNPVSAGEPVVVFEEPFHEHLREGWTWLREEPKAWRIEDNSLVIDTLYGVMWGKEHTASNVLLRTAPLSVEQGFVIEAQITNQPGLPYEHAGIICHFDDDNWVVFTKENLDKKPKIMLGAEQDSKPTFPYPEKVHPDAEVWLRIVLHGKTATGMWRASEKDPWQTLREQPIPASTKELQVGMHSGRGDPETGRKARFRNFRILKLVE